MSHLESLIAEYLEWQGYLIRRNLKVGRRAKGGRKSAKRDRILAAGERSEPADRLKDCI